MVEFEAAGHDLVDVSVKFVIDGLVDILVKFVIDGFVDVTWLGASMYAGFTLSIETFFSPCLNCNVKILSFLSKTS